MTSPFSLSFPSSIKAGDYLNAAECIKVINSALDKAAVVGTSQKRSFQGGGEEILGEKICALEWMKDSSSGG